MVNFRLQKNLIEAMTNQEVKIMLPDVLIKSTKIDIEFRDDGVSTS